MKLHHTSLAISLAILTVFTACNSWTEEEHASFERGNELYISQCISCHGPNGDGFNGAYPSLLKKEILAIHNQRAINLITNGSAFEGGMKPISLSQEEITDVLNYINNAWENDADFLTEETLPKL